VVVPYVASELDGWRILQAVCVHFFLPILRGDLIVDLVSPQTREVHLDSDSLAEWCNALKWDGPKRTKRHVSPPVEYIKRCLTVQKDAVVSRVLGQTKLPE